MNTKLKIVSLILFAVLVFVPLQPAAAKGLMEGQVVFGQSYTLKSGETLQGDLVVFGGSALIENGATVNGSAIVFGGTLDIQGAVTSDAAVVGGSIKLGSRSHVFGDLTTFGGTIERLEGAQVDGQITNAATSWTTDGTSATPIPVEPGSSTPSTPAPQVNFNFQPFTAIANTFGQAIGLALLAMLLMLFLAPHADRTAHAIIAQPLTAGGLGLLTVLVVPVAYVALALLSILIITTIITVPAMVLLGIALAAAVLFGWIAIGYEIGQRLTKAFHQEWHPAFSAGLGTFLLSLVANAASILNFIPGLSCFTWILPAIVSVFALGAVIMTRFGTQSILPVVKAEIVPPAEPAQPPEK
jgi:cytoskeletal protein CcmA (bactofilin family)